MANEIHEAFQNHPWCLKILKDANYTRVVSGIGNNEVDPFFLKLLHTPSTIRAVVHLHNIASQPDRRSEQHASDVSVSGSPDGMPSVREYLMLLAVGEDTIGQAGLCHGGFLATLIDEASGRLLAVNRLDGGSSPYTVLLNVTFKAPVAAPANILVKSRITKVEGRKVFLTSTVQNDKGVICVTADVMFVSRKAKL
ncbi:Hypothetical protein R9X50_00244500 [Acrodontium crateriforme]|uniref:Thioesterase domain-containing protein n=1 Tax=Acrodontium crateriforme TaxID=150365 RepID=A0AAQ3M1J1_9PEZI|nr:Hypothetical protein R9X50_00244500 [Acrodontium crateriforme]